MITRNITMESRSAVAPIDWVYSTNGTTIEMVVTDVTPKTANFYCVSPSGNVYSATGTVSGTSVTFKPVAGFFEVGTNRLELRVTTSGGTVYSFYIPVYCQNSALGEGTPSEAESVVDQVEEAAQKAIAAAATASSKVSATYASNNIASSITIESGVWTEIVTVTAGPGVVLLSAKMLFTATSAATGYRAVSIRSDTETPSTIASSYTGNAVSLACADGRVIVNDIQIVSPTAETTYHVWTYQDSGSDQECYCNVKSVVLATTTGAEVDEAVKLAHTPDTEPTEGSENLITSGAVKTALDNKMDAMTVDNTPKAGSGNLITSGAVFDVSEVAINAIDSVVDEQQTRSSEDEALQKNIDAVSAKCESISTSDIDEIIA